MCKCEACSSHVAASTVSHLAILNKNVEGFLATGEPKSKLSSWPDLITKFASWKGAAAFRVVRFMLVLSFSPLM